MMEVIDLLRALWVVWLVLFFVAVIAWAYWPRNKGRFEADSRIPLRDEPEECRGS
jgi:cytochrome c oxidase cbb3-type subunit 4